MAKIKEFLNNILDLPFEKIYKRIQADLNVKDLHTQGKIVFELSKAPANLELATKLYIMAKKEYEDLEKEYKILYNKKIKIISAKLEEQKRNKLLTRQISESLLETTLINSYPVFFKKWDIKLRNSKYIVKLTEGLLEACRARISTLQSINKRLPDSY